MDEELKALAGDWGEWRRYVLEALRDQKKATEDLRRDQNEAIANLRRDQNTAIENLRKSYDKLIWTVALGSIGFIITLIGQHFLPK